MIQQLYRFDLKIICVVYFILVISDGYSLSLGQLYEKLYASQLFADIQATLIYFYLLYIKERYDQIIEDSRKFIDLMSKDDEWILPQSICLLVVAACYKMV